MGDLNGIAPRTHRTATRAHSEIDALVGPRGRSAFLVEIAKIELRKRRLLGFLSDPEPLWKDEDHPELAQGTNAWVKSLREEGEVRLQEIEEGEKRLNASSARHNDLG